MVYSVLHDLASADLYPHHSMLSIYLFIPWLFFKGECVPELLQTKQIKISTLKFL